MLLLRIRFATIIGQEGYIMGKKIKQLKKEADFLVTARKAGKTRGGTDDGTLDVGIENGYFGTKLSKSISRLKPATKKKLAEHVRKHVDLAMGPLIKLALRDHDEFEADYLRQVGPNMLRTIIEALEE